MKVLTRLETAIRLGYTIGLPVKKIAEYNNTTPMSVRVIACRLGWSRPKRTGINRKNIPADKLVDYNNLVYRKGIKSAEAMEILGLRPRWAGVGTAL